MAESYGPKVQGRCRGCGLSSLFLDGAGFVICASHSCPSPGASGALLHRGTSREGLAALQEEHAQWTRRNFPGQTSHQPLLGVIEEVGELAHAHLKNEQKIRGYGDARGGDVEGRRRTRAEVSDAIGDIVIYLSGYCTTNGYDLQECVETAWAEVSKRDWVANPETGRPADWVDNKALNAKDDPGDRPPNQVPFDAKSREFDPPEANLMDDAMRARAMDAEYSPAPRYPVTHSHPDMNVHPGHDQLHEHHANGVVLRAADGILVGAFRHWDGDEACAPDCQCATEASAPLAAHIHSFHSDQGATGERLPSGVVVWTCACSEATYNERSGF